MTRAQMDMLGTVLEVREDLIVRLATFAGMRPGEILGLRVGDVSEDSLKVERRTYRGNIDTPKSRASARVVPLEQGAKTLLGEWLGLLRDRGPDAWVFPSENSLKPLRLDNVWRRNVRPRLKKIGLDWANFQVMRRSFATLMYEAGVSAKVRGDIMGHGAGVNEAVYTLTPFNQKQEAIRKLESTTIQ